jgi:hypothetical protein
MFTRTLRKAQGGAHLRVRALVMLSLVGALLLLASSVQARQYVTIERINVTAVGQQANQGQRPVVSGDGRFVAYWSDSQIIIPGDVNNLPDIFLRDRLQNKVSYANWAAGGTQATGGTTYAEIDISDGGTLVVYASDANNLVTGDTNGFTDVFVYDYGVNVSARVSVAKDNVQANGKSYRPVISGNGILVAYRSEATNLVLNDTNGQADVFLFDRSPGLQFPVARINVGSDGTTQANMEDGTDPIAINFDGSQVVWVSKSNNLVGGDTNNAKDIYVRDRKVNPQQTRRISISTNGTQANGESSAPAINGNGRFVAFASSASNLVDGDTNNASDIFLVDRDTDNDGVFDEAGAISTTRVSVATGGAQANGNSTTPSIDSSGRYISFWSAASNLVENDTNGVADIFVYDVKEGSTTRISVNKDGAQANGASAPFNHFSADSRFVAFESLANNLVPNDTNGVNDVFLAQAMPDAPTDLVATGVSPTQINLAWKDKSEDETKFVVERSNNGGQSWTKIADNVAANSESYQDKNIPECGEYSYRVFAVNNVGTSVPSNVATANTLDCPPGKFTLTAPVDNAAVVNPANITFQWTAASEADTYDFVVERTAPDPAQLVDVTLNAGDVCNAETKTCALQLNAQVVEQMVNGDYSWEVTATNEKGTTAASNNPETFLVDTTLEPREFTLLTPENRAIFRDGSKLSAFTWQFNPDAETFEFTLLKLSNNPTNRDLGVVVAEEDLTPLADSDKLTCDASICTYSVDAALQAQLTTGTYAWTALAVSPGGTPTEASNAAFLFSINTEAYPLLTNTSFEDDVDEDGVPDDWTARDATKDKRKCNKDTDGDGTADKIVANTGVCAFEFKGGAGEKSRLQQKPDVESLGLVNGDNLTLSAFVQGKNALADATTIQVKVKYEDETLSADKLTLTAASGSYAYDQLSGQLTVDGAVKSVTVRLQNTAVSGKVLVDDVVLVLGATTAQRDGLAPLPLPGVDNPSGSSFGTLPLPEVETSEFGRQ